MSDAYLLSWIKKLQLNCIMILLLSTGENTGLKEFVNILMIEVSYPKNTDKVLLKAQNNHIITLIKKMPTEITMGVGCSTEKFCCKTGDE